MAVYTLTFDGLTHLATHVQKGRQFVSAMLFCMTINRYTHGVDMTPRPPTCLWCVKDPLPTLFTGTLVI